MTVERFRGSRPHALLAIVFALGLVGAGAGAAYAWTGDARADKAKLRKVAVVVDDTHMEEMEAEHAEAVEEEEEHAPGTMSMTVSPSSVRHGKVKFTVENAGSEVHEFVVLKTKKKFDGLPVNADDEVNEATARGEIENIGAGKTKSKTMKLTRGHYVLVCNIAGHYGAGMRADFKVT